MSRRFQFSVRALLVTVAVVAADLGLMLGPPPNIAEPVLAALIVLAAAVFTTGLVYGGERVRPFCIGGLFPTAIACFWVVDRIPAIAEHWFPPPYSGGIAVGLFSHDAQRNAVLFGSVILISMLFGNVCLAIRWMVSNPQQ